MRLFSINYSGYLFQKFLKEFPDFVSGIQVFVCPTVSAVYDLIQPDFVTVNPVNKLMRA